MIYENTLLVLHSSVHVCAYFGINIPELLHKHTKIFEVFYSHLNT